MTNSLINSKQTMKNPPILLILFISAITLNSSCKKDEKKRDDKLLTSGKWYYDYIINLRAGSTVNSCFNEKHYIEFRTDGTVSIVTFDKGYDYILAEGTYSLNEDGKTFTMNADNRQWTGIIHLIKDNYLRMTLAPDNFYSYELTLAHKKANPSCQPPK